jgi:putative salt-induced outer membrane protein YdiY
VAFRYGREFRFQYFPVREDLEDESIIAPKFGAKLRYALDKSVIFTEAAEVLPTVVGPSRVLVNSITKLTTRVVAALGVGVAFEVKHDSRPAPGKKPTDTALTFSLEAAF